MTSPHSCNPAPALAEHDRTLQQHIAQHEVCAAGASSPLCELVVVQLVAKATFARERAAQARQQVQHLTSLGLADKSAAASRTVSSQEQLLSVRARA